MRRFSHSATVVALALFTSAANAAVVDSTPTGFEIAQTVHIAAPPDAVYAALIVPAKWWNSEHTFSGNAGNLRLEAKGGGCFCESWPDGSVQHATVVDADEGRVLQTPTGTPALTITRRFVSGPGLLEVSETIYPADRFSYEIRLERDVGPDLRRS